MLEGIVGSKSAMRVLFFLFVNEEGYASQIKTLLDTPLTPIQKTLERLEKEEILVSRFQGKLRMYSMNPSYPLLCELELLLKKAYGLLPCSEKKRYCFIHKPKLSFNEEREKTENARKDLLALWEVLGTVTKLSFSATTKRGGEECTKIGKADVEVISELSTVRVFSEKGYWFEGANPENMFSNTFRWTLDIKNLLISLEHLRYGPSRPVFLFHLTPKGDSIFEAVDSHLCASDVYLGYIRKNKKGFDFRWRIIGPAKNDTLTYRYLSE